MAGGKLADQRMKGEFMKKFIRTGVAVAMCLCMLLACGITAMAADTTEYSVVLDGQKLVFDQPPINKDGRILVPMRAIFEAYGATVSWDQKTRTVTATTEYKTIKLTVDKNAAYINGALFTLDVPPIIVNGSTLVPVRFVSEALDATVTWNKPVVTIVTNKRVTETPIANPAEGNMIVEPITPPDEVVQATPVQNPPVETKPVETTPVVNTTPVVVSGDDIDYGPGYYSDQDGISGACYITSIGMIATNLTGVEYPASKVYSINGNSVIGGTEALFQKLNIVRDARLSLTGMSNSEKVRTVVNLLKKNPEGVIVKFESSTTHFIVVRGYIDGKLIVNDPANANYKYLPLDRTWTGKSMFADYESAISGMVLVEYYSPRQ